MARGKRPEVSEILWAFALADIQVLAILAAF
jgi:hypothetical protein